MALVTISGYPCSGKTRRAQQLKEDFESRLASPSYSGPALKVVIISDDELSVPRSSYDDGRAEKPARSALYTALLRSLGSNTIVIVDGMNYIKGFRYQMYCAARELSIRVCTVFVVAPPDQCREWNTTRDASHQYVPATLDNLVTRFEEPSSMVRWDSPLFTLLWNEETAPLEDIWKAVTAGEVKPPNAGTAAAAKPPTDALHNLEQTTSSIVSQIATAQSLDASGGNTPLTLDAVKLTVVLPARKIALAELQRYRRQFVSIHKKAITQGLTDKEGGVDWSERNIGQKFVEYLQDNLRP